MIATNNQKRTRKIPPQGAGDDEEDEENDQGWRDPRGYPCTHYLAVAHKNDSDFQPGGDYHECSLQGSNRVGYSSLQGVIEIMSVYLYIKTVLVNISRENML